MNWIERPTSLLCLPDGYMGPDIVLYIRLASGVIIALVVQVKLRSLDTLPSNVLRKTKASLDHGNFYRHKVLV